MYVGYLSVDLHTIRSMRENIDPEGRITGAREMNGRRLGGRRIIGEVQSQPDRRRHRHSELQ